MVKLPCQLLISMYKITDISEKLQKDSDPTESASDPKRSLTQIRVYLHDSFQYHLRILYKTKKKERKDKAQIIKLSTCGFT